MIECVKKAHVLNSPSRSNGRAWKTIQFYELKIIMIACFWRNNSFLIDLMVLHRSTYTKSVCIEHNINSSFGEFVFFFVRLKNNFFTNSDWKAQIKTYWIFDGRTFEWSASDNIISIGKCDISHSQYWLESLTLKRWFQAYYIFLSYSLRIKHNLECLQLHSKEKKAPVINI